MVTFLPANDVITRLLNNERRIKNYALKLNVVVVESWDKLKFQLMGERIPWFPVLPPKGR